MFYNIANTSSLVTIFHDSQSKVSIISIDAILLGYRKALVSTECLWHIVERPLQKLGLTSLSVFIRFEQFTLYCAYVHINANTHVLL